MLQRHAIRAVGGHCRGLGTHLPRPDVAEPQVGQDMERGRLRARVRDPDLHQQVVRVALGVDHVHDPVAVVVEDPGVQQLVLRLRVVSLAVLGDEVAVGELALRVVVAPLQQRVARQRIEVPPVLLDVLPVVALGAGQAEHPLLEDRVAPVPQCQGHAQVLLDVADAGHAVLAPAVGAGPGMVVREVVPRRPVGAVVLPDCAPRAFGEVGTPVVPGGRLPQPVLGVAEGIHSLAFGAGHLRTPPLRQIPP